MLAQNFKSAVDLGISEKSHDALRKTLTLMETGKLTFTDVDHVDVRSFHPSKNLNLLFNMGYWAVGTECGTVCCIGGTAERVGGVVLGSREHPMPQTLEDLFFPDESFFKQITVEQGAQALRNYLTYGEPKWKEVING